MILDERNEFADATSLSTAATGLALVVLLVGWTPPYSLRQVGSGIPVRTVVLLPVGRLPSFIVRSSTIALSCDSSSAMLAI